MLLALFTTLTTLAVHSIVYTYFLATGKWAKEVVRVYQIPDGSTPRRRRTREGVPVRDLEHDVDRHRRLARRRRPTPWHEPALAPGDRRAGLAFNLGAFAVEYAVIVAQARLLMEVKDQADHLREAALRPRKPTAAAGRPLRSRGRVPLMSPLGVVVLIVLVDLLGFTIVMPLLAPFAKQYGFSALQIGLLFAAYPMCQLVAGPILGRLSDRYGRRPLLIFSQAGTALSFLILGLSRDFG